ncbi:MAG: CoA-acylating methylmalonate-semialdehyde dehydrogenase [Chloroflexi bacterium]|nr:MAG: CoA-acylating methylmalonate-semialdehyde dehydrogenase [Chloroflexota bacterium]TME20734.1 MAG: CoA-acylating methylmalonate-semialdehyde dehydrogenase [Chloroflexota bacterium]
MIPNLIGGEWLRPEADTLPVYDPATGEVIEQVPLSGTDAVTAAVAAADAAYKDWSRTPVMDRVRLMFSFKARLEAGFEDLARIVTRHHGKTLDEARGEVRRGVEVVDFACGAPTLLQGRTLRDVSGGVDQDLYRFPLGVVAGVPPFNFPVMIPLWMFPLAVVAGNTFVLKPSERTPLGAVRLAELFTEAGFPPGVLNLVHGAGPVVDALLTNPAVAAISFVGSAPVARHVYEVAAAQGKRVQALGGAKNHIVVMPDADLDAAVPAILGSAFGNAGERCLAGSVAVAVGDASGSLLEPLLARAAALKVGPGVEPGVDVGPLIRAEHRDRVAGYIERGAAEGAVVLLDGRSETSRAGFFLGPTVLDRVSDSMAVGRDEIFGPVLSVSHAATLEEAIGQANRMSLGNMAVIFTRSGKAARQFREQVDAGMIGVNVPVAQPFAFFPFSGWKGSFFGDLHVHGTDGIDFYTRKKMFISRW